VNNFGVRNPARQKIIRWQTDMALRATGLEKP
jgi:hypothetical protein